MIFFCNLLFSADALLKAVASLKLMTKDGKGLALSFLIYLFVLSKRLTEIRKEVAMGNIELRNSLEVKLCPFVAPQCSHENIRKKD